MSYAFTQDVPVNKDLYDRIIDGLGPEVPKGLVFHMAVERPEGGLRYFDLWESEEDWDRFAEERLHPVVHPLLAGMFGDRPIPEPTRTELPVIHFWGALGG